jgi:hypothetical protein
LAGAHQVGVTPSRAFIGVMCECDESTSKWNTHLLKFWVQAYIVVRTHLFTGGKYYERTAKSVSGTIAHEQVHVNNYKKWHDVSEPKVKSDFSKDNVFDSKKSCVEYIRSKGHVWSNSFYQAVYDEIHHKNGPHGGGGLDVIGEPGTDIFGTPPDPYVSPFSNLLKVKDYTK